MTEYLRSRTSGTNARKNLCVARTQVAIPHAGFIGRSIRFHSHDMLALLWSNGFNGKPSCVSTREKSIGAFFLIRIDRLKLRTLLRGAMWTNACAYRDLDKTFLVQIERKEHSTSVCIGIEQGYLARSTKRCHDSSAPKNLPTHLGPMLYMSLFVLMQFLIHRFERSITAVYEISTA